MVARIIKNGLVSYLRDFAKHQKQIKSIHMSAAHGMYLRRLVKVIDKSEWFRKEQDLEMGVGCDIEKARVPTWRGSLKRDRKARTVTMDKVEVRIASVLFVPQTPQSGIDKSLRVKMDEMAPSLGWKYRIVEKSGLSIKDKVTKSNLWSLEM